MPRIRYHGKVKLYNHNLTYRNYYSGEIGELRPIWLEDAVPGDQISYTPEIRAYFAPLVFPVLTKLDCRVDVYFVPNRLAWSEWENFITGGPENQLSPAYPSVRHVFASLAPGAQPSFTTWWNNQTSTPGGILDNLGMPTGTYDKTKCPYDMIPFWDYLNIYDNWYRDEEKIEAITEYGGIRRDVYDVFQNGTIAAKIFALSGGLFRKAWSKDYFTTASLQQQRGGDIPLLSNPMFQFVDGSGFPTALGTVYIAGTSSTPVGMEGAGTLVASDDGNAGTALESVLTINGLRNLYAAAAWQNNNVVGGTRYIEVIRNRYRVVSSDARLQRPEFIGSTHINVNIDVVTQTSSTVEDSDTVQPLGDRAGKASVIGRGKTFTYGVEEFGYFMAICHIAPKAAYFQGIRRNLQREDKFDFWMPEFTFTPQQEIRNNEIYADASTLEPETGGTFGYTGRFNEYRHHSDEVHGSFRTSLLAWTMARKFSSLPSVSSRSFLEVDSDAQGNNRIFAVPDTENDHIFGVVNNIVSFKREIVNTEPHF